MRRPFHSFSRNGTAPFPNSRLLIWRAALHHFQAPGLLPLIEKLSSDERSFVRRRSTAERRPSRSLLHALDHELPARIAPQVFVRLRKARIVLRRVFDGECIELLGVRVCRAI